MYTWSRDEAKQRVAASALTLRLVNVEPQECAQLLYGLGTFHGLAAPEQAVAWLHRTVLAEVSSQGYSDVVKAELDGIASALGLDHEDDVCDWEQLLAAFPEPWFLDEEGVMPRLVALKPSVGPMSA